MTAFGPTIRRLLLDPAMLLFGAANFAFLVGIEVPEAAGIANAEIWSGVALTAYLLVGIALSYWVVRALAGNATGLGRFWKWLGYSLGVGLVTVLPSVIAGIISADIEGRHTVGWVESIASVIAQLVMFLPCVRVNALAISGDRIRFDQVRDILGDRIMDLLPWLLCTSTIIWGSELVLSAPAISDSLHPVALALIQTAAWTLGTCLSTAVIIAAYLAVDRSSGIDGARDTFG